MIVIENQNLHVFLHRKLKDFIVLFRPIIIKNERACDIKWNFPHVTSRVITYFKYYLFCGFIKKKLHF